MESTINTNVSLIVQLAAATLTGLVAGLLYGYQCSVIRGLGQLPDGGYLQAFQSINKEIQNPYFFLAFLGSILVLGTAAWQSHVHHAGSFYLLLPALLLYCIGVVGVTIIGNVPLNEQLANFQAQTATAAELHAIRKAFEYRWNTYHSIRTAAAIISFVLVLIALTKNKP